MVQEVSLVFSDGNVHPVTLYGASSGGSGIIIDDSFCSVSTIVHFFRIVDIAEVTAVRIGERELTMS